jgi:hypothetical protein
VTVKFTVANFGAAAVGAGVAVPVVVAVFTLLELNELPEVLCDFAIAGATELMVSRVATPRLTAVVVTAMCFFMESSFVRGKFPTRLRLEAQADQKRETQGTL